MNRIRTKQWVYLGLLLTACGAKGEGALDSGADSADPVDHEDHEDTGTSDSGGEDIEAEDRDNDGYGPDDGDCDDNDPDRHPGAEERCNGIDDDCNDIIDDGFPDVDEDGTADCLDEEECDGVDNDGDGEIDEEFDLDEDGLADCLEETECNGLDDDDDGIVDDGFDADGDGYTTCGDPGTEPDCRDDDPDVHPDAPDIEDGLDNDCDRLIDEDMWAPGDLVITEILANPELVSDAFGEWFEVQNQSGRTLPLNGLEIVSAAERHMLESPERIELEPGAVYVFGVSDSLARNGGVPVDYAYRDVELSDDIDVLALFLDDRLIDEVVWNVSTDWPALVGETWSLDPDFIDDELNDAATYWCAGASAWAADSDLGSPGTVNTPCTSFDHDGDGISSDDGDCDDTDADVYPGAPEVDAGIDNDCDDVVAAMPVAWADYDTTSSTLSSCDTLQLDGERSFDPDGDSLSYSWSVDAVPDGSTSSTETLVSSTSSRPTFEPDLSGEYSFSLVVSDGTYTSASSRLTLGIHDPDIPEVDAGEDQSHTDSVVCDVPSSIPGDSACPVCDAVTFSLGGTEPFPDSVTAYTWDLTSEWSSISIDDVGSRTPLVTVSGLQPLEGESVSASADVALQVTDCTGRITYASVHLEVSCAGLIPDESSDSGLLDTGSVPGD